MLTMGYLFTAERLVIDPSRTVVDSSLLKANDHVWYKSFMKKGIVSCPAGIDTDASWGYSHTNKG